LYLLSVEVQFSHVAECEEVGGVHADLQTGSQEELDVGLGVSEERRGEVRSRRGRREEREEKRREGKRRETKVVINKLSKI
jgi:hypothetical protein